MALPLRKSMRLASAADDNTRGGVASLRNNAGKASEDAYMVLRQAEAIDYNFGSVLRNFGRYPDEITGNNKCHFRALWNIAPEAAMEAMRRGLKSSDELAVKEIASRHSNEAGGQVFRLRKDDPVLHHWVSITHQRYTDDAKWFATKDYVKAVGFLELLEMPEDVIGGVTSSVALLDVDEMMKH